MADNKTNIVITAQDATAAAFNSAKRNIDTLSSAAAALGVTLSAAGLVAFVKSSLDAADSMNDLAQRTGVGIKALAGFKLAAEQSGASLESVAKGIKGLSTYMAEHGDALKAVVGNTANADEAMTRLADLFAALPDGMQKSALATKLFGKAGQDLIPMLNLGSKGLQEAKDKAAAYATQMERLAPSADQFNDRMAELKLSATAAGMQLSNALAPTLNDMAAAFAEVTKESGLLAGAWASLGALGSHLFTSDDVPRIEKLGKAIKDLQGNLSTAATPELRNALKAQIAKLETEREALERSQKSDPKPGGGDENSIKRLAEDRVAALKKEAEVQQQVNLLMGKNEEAVRKSADAYETFIKSLQTKVALEEAEAANGQPLTEAQKVRVELEGKLDEMLGKSNPKKRAAAQAEIDHLVALTQTNAANKEWLEFQQAAEKANNDRLATLESQADALEKELATYGMTKSQIEDTTIARLEEARAIVVAHGATDDQLKALDAEIAARKRLKDAMIGVEAKDQAKKAAEESERAWRKFSDDIESSLTDALMRGFENGESFGENFVNSIRNTLKTAALKIVVQAVVDPVMGTVRDAVGGNPGIGSSSGINLSNVSSLSSLFDSGNAGINNLFGSFAGSSLGQSLGLSSSASFVGPQVAGQSAVGLTTLGQNLQTALPYLPALYSLSQGNYGAAAGSAIGAYFGGPVGRVVGSAIGGLLDGGDHNNSKYGAPNKFVVNLAGNAQGLTGGSGTQFIWQATRNDGGQHREVAAFSATQQAAISDSIKALFQSYTGVAAALGANLPTAIANAADFIKTKGGGGRDADFYVGLAVGATVGEAVQNSLANLSDQIALSLVPNLKALQQAGESLGQSLSRLVNEFQLTDQIASAMGKDAKTAIGSLANRDALVQLLGGAGNAGAAFGSYYGNFYSDEERQKAAADNVNATLKSLGVQDLPATREQFRALVEAQNLTTDSGRKMFASLVAISEAFAGVTQATDELHESANDLTRDLSSDGFRTAVDFQFAQKTGLLPRSADPFGLASELAGLRDDIRAVSISLAEASRKTAKVLDGWDADGMPDVRVLS